MRPARTSFWRVARAVLACLVLTLVASPPPARERVQDASALVVSALASHVTAATGRAAVDHARIIPLGSARRSTPPGAPPSLGSWAATQLVPDGRRAYAMCCVLRC